MVDWINSLEIFEILNVYKDEKEIKDEISKVINLLGIAEKSRICDFVSRDCRLAIEFAKMGYRVTAVDSLKKPLEKAKKFCDKQKIDIEISVENLRNFARSEYFDVIFCISIPFCFFDNDEDFRVIKNLLRSLKTGGRLFLKLISKELYIKNFNRRAWFIKEKNFILTESKLVDDWSKIETKWIFLDTKKKRELKALFKMYSGFEIRSFLRQAGIEEIKLFGDLEGNHFDENAQGLFALAIKK